MERSPEEVMSFLVETEEKAEEVLASKQQIIDLDRKRNKTREALRVLHKDKTEKKQWVCFGNMFIKLPKQHTKQLLQKDFDNLDNEIDDVRKSLKVKVNQLRDLENKETVKGFDLQPLTREEFHSVEGVL